MCRSPGKLRSQNHPSPCRSDQRLHYLSRVSNYAFADDRSLHGVSGARVLATAAAAFGISLGIALLPAWLRSAPAGQLPGFMTAVGLDARASYRFFAGLVALALLTPPLGMPVVTRLCEGRRWAFVGATAALSSSLWIALAKETVAWVAIPPLLTVAICHRLRFVRQRFTRSDAILLPTALCVFVALTDIAPNAAFPRRIVVS